MDTTLIHGFLAEQKAISIIFICVGIISVILAFIFFKIIKYSLFNGLAISILVFGIGETAAGTVHIYSSGTIANVIDRGDTAGSQTLTTQKILQELSSNEVLLFMSSVCFVLGLILLIKFYNSTQVFWKGIGLGLLIQGLLFTALLFVQEYNLKEYYNYMINITYPGIRLLV